MSDTQGPAAEQELTPEQIAQMQAVAVEQAMQQVVLLPTAFGWTDVTQPDGTKAGLLEIRTPAGTTRLGLTIERAQQLAAFIMRNTEPPSGLFVPPSANGPGLYVAGQG